MQAALQVEPTPRVFDPDRSAYLGGVDRMLLERAGVRYLKIRDSIHPGGEAFKVAFENGVPVEEFVSNTMSDFGLKSVSEIGSVSGAGYYNSTKAAMCEFAISSAWWTRGRDGFLYHETPDGVAVMRPVLDRKTGRYGFGIEFREGASMDRWLTGLKELGTVVARIGKMDIGDAVAEFEKSREARARFAF